MGSVLPHALCLYGCMGYCLSVGLLPGLHSVYLWLCACVLGVRYKYKLYCRWAGWECACVRQCVIVYLFDDQVIRKENIHFEEEKRGELRSWGEMSVNGMENAANCSDSLRLHLLIDPHPICYHSLFEYNEVRKWKNRPL